MVTPSNTGGSPILVNFSIISTFPIALLGGRKSRKRDFLASSVTWGFVIFDNICAFPHGMLRPKNDLPEVLNSFLSLRSGWEEIPDLDASHVNSAVSPADPLLHDVGRLGSTGVDPHHRPTTTYQGSTRSGLNDPRESS